MVFERYVVVECFDDVMFGCFSGVIFDVHRLWAMVGWGGIICVIGDIVRCGGDMWLLVVYDMLLVLCLDVWHELVARLDVYGFVIMFDWWLGVFGMVML